MDRIIASKKDFVAGALCFAVNVTITLVGMSIPNIRNTQGMAIIAAQLGLLAATLRCWSDDDGSSHHLVFTTNK